MRTNCPQEQSILLLLSILYLSTDGYSYKSLFIGISTYLSTVSTD